MKATNSRKLSAKVITLAVQGALFAMCAAPVVARADEPSAEVTALTKPTNSVDIGAEYVPQSSAKFGEYNGLDKKGTYLIGNFDLRGGDAYDAANGGAGTKRVEIKGTDLGTTSREFGLDVSDQGKWSFGFGYDELRHNLSDTYQTPFLGAMGGNSFTVPSNFGTINTANTLPAPGNASLTYKPGSNAMTGIQKGDFTTPEVYSQRENSKFNAGFVFDSHWNVKFDYNHLVQTGAKLLGVGTDDVVGTTSKPSSNYYVNEANLVIMNPTNYITDTFNLALNWAGDNAYATASFYSSIFKDNNSEVTFNNPFTSGTPTTGITTDAISTMPSNNFNQLNLNGGYSFTSATKLVGGVSYARNGQDDSYSTDPALTVLNRTPNQPTSLNGLVITSHADVKLTNQTTSDLQLSAVAKYDKRDNQTASIVHNFTAIDYTQENGVPNMPMSNTKTQFDLVGDYRIDKKQKLNLDIGSEIIQRSCNGDVIYPTVSGFVSGSYPGSIAGTAGTFTPTGCASVPDSRESKVTAAYKLKATDDLNLNAGIGYANRVADETQNYYAPYMTGGKFDVPGFGEYWDATRREAILKAGANWQATDKLSFAASGRYTSDKYDESTYGVQNGTSNSLNLDATYAAAEHTVFTLYGTSQYKSRAMTNTAQLANKAPVTGTNGTANVASVLSNPGGLQTFTNTLTQNDLTIGLGAKQGGLMGNKLDLSGDVTYSHAKSTYDTELNYVSADGNGNTCSSVYFQTCGALPDITSDTLRVKLSGAYKVDKFSKFTVGYLFQQLRSTDYLYNAYQTGSATSPNTMATLLPTNQQAPSYSVNVVSVSYTITY
jgi:MtrB/PioB family decaheme-associated outer membrane protein